MPYTAAPAATPSTPATTPAKPRRAAADTDPTALPRPRHRRGLCFFQMLKAVFLDVGGVFHLPAEEPLRDALRGAGFELPPNVLARAHYAGMTGHDRFDGDYAEVMKPYVEEMVRDLAVPEKLAPGARTALYQALSAPGAWAGTLRE